MRSRLAIIAMLVFGMVLSTGGGALAVSGFTSQQDNAAQGQYGPSDDNGDDEGGDVLGEDESGNPRPRTAARRRGRGLPARAPGRGRRPGHRRRAAAVHRLRGDPDPARRRRAADHGPRAPPAHRRRNLSQHPRLTSGPRGPTASRSAGARSAFEASMRQESSPSAGLGQLSDRGAAPGAQPSNLHGDHGSGQGYGLTAPRRCRSLCVGAVPKVGGQGRSARIARTKSWSEQGRMHGAITKTGRTS